MGIAESLGFLYEVRLKVKKQAGQKGKVWRGMDLVRGYESWELLELKGRGNHLRVMVHEWQDGITE